MTAEKSVVWLTGESVKSPPFSQEARLEAGYLIWRLQNGEMLTLPYSRPMPSIGKLCHELRIQDKDVTWRIIYRIDQDAIVIVMFFKKKTPTTPKNVVATSKRRLKEYDDGCKKAEKD